MYFSGRCMKICNFNKKRFEHRCFNVSIVKFLRTPILKNSCKRHFLTWSMSDICRSKKKINAAEAATRGALCKKVFLEISQNSQENACARVSLLIQLQVEPCNYIKKESLPDVFLWILLNF